MNNEMIVVRQLPIIEEQLRELKEQNQHRVESVLSMPCDENTVKALKKERAALNKEFADFETRRKEVKAQVLAPWNQFEAVYQDCVSDVFKGAETQLKAKITEVESGLKAQKAEAIREYYDELAQTLGIDFLPFDKSGIEVTLSASMKSLRDKVNNTLTQISEDLRMIGQQEYAAEILVEYKKDLFHVSAAMSAVTERHRAIEEERQRREEIAHQEEQQAEVARQVEQAAEAWSAPAPVAVPEEGPTPEPVDEKRYTVRFTVKNVTKAQALALKNFLNDGGYDYE